MDALVSSALRLISSGTLSFVSTPALNPPATVAVSVKALRHASGSDPVLTAHIPAETDGVPVSTETIGRAYLISLPDTLCTGRECVPGARE